jgi:hypothetical protein
MRLICGMALMLATPAQAVVTADQIERSVHLRDDQKYLTENVADPGSFTADGRTYAYRKTVAGGFQFVLYDPTTGSKAPAFNHARLAEGLGKAMGEPITADRLPIQRFNFVEGGKALQFGYEEEQWRCDLATYACVHPAREKRPSGFGVVRDLAVPADNHPRRSPDGKWEAHVENFNIAVRPVGAAVWKRISSDGSDANFYDPETIVWSPDSGKLAAYRVRPGFRRIVYKVRSSPTDQIQPELTTQLYPKPGDAVDIETPVLLDAAAGRQIPIAGSLFENPYDMSPLEWRKDSASLSFVYEQRGHQLARVISVDAATGAPHAAVTEQAKTFINEGRRFRYDLDNGREVIWMSERDGWNHLYLFDGKTGAVKKQITKRPLGGP